MYCSEVDISEILRLHVFLSSVSQSHFTTNFVSDVYNTKTYTETHESSLREIVNWIKLYCLEVALS